MIPLFRKEEMVVTKKKCDAEQGADTKRKKRKEKYTMNKRLP